MIPYGGIVRLLDGFYNILNWILMQDAQNHLFSDRYLTLHPELLPKHDSAWTLRQAIRFLI